MNEQMRNYLAADPELYPHELEQRFPRVLNKIADAWERPDAAMACFDDLLVDRRGNRQGFPPEVAREIFRLSVAYENLRAKPEKTDDPWANERAVAELKDLGLKATPHDLLRVAETANPEKLRLFLRAGVAVDTRDTRDWTPLMIASFHGNEPAAKFLIDNGADARARDRDGYTPLHWAALQGYQEVTALLAKRASPNVQSNSGVTPLLQAAASGHAPVVKLLLAAGADPNIATNEGWTALHKAVANGHVEVVRSLVRAGASLTAKHNDGTTPLALAVKKKREDILHVIREALPTREKVPAQH